MPTPIEPRSARGSGAARFVRPARVALLAGLWGAAVALAGCGAPRVGSAKLPEGLSRSIKLRRYGPVVTAKSPTRLGSSNSRSAPAPRRKLPVAPAGASAEGH